MSPELLFVLTLLTKMGVAAAFVVAASVITERAGPVIGALVSTLPVSAGPAYVFLALDHSPQFIADSALISLPVNAATFYFALTYVLVAQRHGLVASLLAGLAVWVPIAIATAFVAWTLLTAVAFNLVAFVICVPAVRRFRAVKMPLVTRRWYDIPLRAAMVATLVAAVVTLSNRVGPTGSGILALYPIVFTSLMLILHPRIGGPATAAVIANGLWGLVGFGVAIFALQVTAVPLGSVMALSIGLAVAVGWNISLWLLRRLSRPSSRPPA
jgi:hypothetical protein